MSILNIHTYDHLLYLYQLTSQLNDLKLSEQYILEFALQYSTLISNFSVNRSFLDISFTKIVWQMGQCAIGSILMLHSKILQLNTVFSDEILLNWLGKYMIINKIMLAFNKTSNMNCLFKQVQIEKNENFFFYFEKFNDKELL